MSLNGEEVNEKSAPGFYLGITLKESRWYPIITAVCEPSWEIPGQAAVMTGVIKDVEEGFASEEEAIAYIYGTAMPKLRESLGDSLDVVELQPVGRA